MSTEGEGQTSRARRMPDLTLGLLAKILSLGILNATAIWTLPTLIGEGVWVAVAFVVVATIALDVVYLSRAPRWVPYKYLIPGTVFLVVFQIYPVIYTAYISGTNLGTGNILNQEQATEQLVRNSLASTASDISFQATAAQAADGTIGLILTDPATGDILLGTADDLQVVTPADLVIEDERIIEAAGFVRLGLADANALGTQLTDLTVPSDQGLIRLQTASRAALVAFRYSFDGATQTLTDTETGQTYAPVKGFYTSDDGDRLTPGWQTVVGFENYRRVLTSEAIRGPFIRVFVWNWAFAVGSVLLQFTVGLGIALALDHRELRGRRIYRSLLIFPWALPSFLTVLVWEGMLNRQFGVINGLLNTDIAWLTDPWLARLSVLLVNTWVGFPYFFLVSTGALQSLPKELSEAAAVDGASPFQGFRRVKLPLLLVSLAPLLISSFAFNFNNFNVVFFLTRGGPPIVGAQTPAGNTDLLVTYTYRLAFQSGRGQDLGLATAISVLIFLHVALFSAWSFRKTAKLEDL